MAKNKNKQKTPTKVETPVLDDLDQEEFDLNDPEFDQDDLLGDLDDLLIDATPDAEGDLDEQETETAPPEHEPIVEDAPKKSMNDIRKSVTEKSNPNSITWVTDQYGITKDLKAALIKVGSAIRGQKDKKTIVDSILRDGIAFINARYEADKVK